MCTDHRCLTACQKQHRQNEPAGRVDVSTGVKVRVMGDPGQMYRPQMSYHLSKTTQRESAGQVEIPTRVEVRVMGDPGDM